MELGLKTRSMMMLICAGAVVLPGCPAEPDPPAEDSTSGGADSSDAGPTGDDNSSDPSATTEGATTMVGGTGSSSGSADGMPTATESTSVGTEGDTSTTDGPSLCEGRTIVGLDSAIGIRYGDIPPSGGGGMTSGGSGGGEISDDNVSLRLAAYPLTCMDPSGDPMCLPDPQWRLSFNIPVELQQPGIYTFDEVNMGWSVVGPGAGRDCPFGGGGGGEGNLIIESWGDTIEGCVETNDGIFFDFDPNGSFVAERCM